MRHYPLSLIWSYWHVDSQAYKERPWRRYDQDKETNDTYRHIPTVEADVSQGAEGSRTYRLDIELGRLEFLMHPGMAKEDLLVSKMMNYVLFSVQLNCCNL